MKLIRPDAEGCIVCPQCKRRYKPELPIPDPSDRRAIQDIYPDAEFWQREQQLTGICCERCRDLHFTGEAPHQYDEKGNKC